MTLLELKNKIRQLNIPESTYSLDGKLIPTAIILDRLDKQKWRVFHLDERGNYYDDQTFVNEEDAYRYMLTLLERVSILFQHKRGSC